MIKLTGIIIVVALIIGCKKEKDCEITNPGNLHLNGCLNFMVFDSIKVSGIEHSYISIWVNRDELDLNGQFKSFEVQNNSDITSAIETFNKQSNDCYCSDAIDTSLEKLKTWNIQSGAVEIRIVREKSECDDTYVVDVILRNATFIVDENNEIFIGYKEFLNVLVNYLIG